jgi:predicted nucleic acid-binding protein
MTFADFLIGDSVFVDANTFLYHFGPEPVSAAHVVAATSIGQQTGRLTNDALVVAMMRDSGLTNLASHDADFDRATGVRRFAPI